MSIANDWDIDYANKEIRHVDGILTYDGGAGTQPSVGEYIIGLTSGAVAKVIARTGNAAAGTLTLTNVLGQFANNEKIDIMSELAFDAITPANGGFAVGDTIVGNVSASTIAVKAIEYNCTTVAGWGKMFGRPMSAAFTNDEQLNISGGTADVADADGTGTDNDAKWEADVDGALAVPGTANTNNSVIVHYDGGTIDIPEDAKISDATTGAYGNAQRVYGATATGSIRLVNSNTTAGAWADDHVLQIEDVVFYKALVSGKVFEVGNVIHGLTSGKEGRVLAVINDGDSTGKLILADKTGTFTNLEDIQVKESGVWTKYGEVENLTAVLAAATLNLPGGVRSVQRSDQGGIYPNASLNIVRSSNALYTYIQDTFDELGQLDDKAPIKANFKDLIYTLINGWRIPDLSFRFAEKGAWQDTTRANVWTDYQSLGEVADIGDHGFLYSASNPTPQPNFYLEQDGAVLRQDWLEGHVDVNIKVKTSTDPRYIDPATPALGQLIDNGTVTWWAGEYLRTYFHFQTTTVGGTAPIPFSTKEDANNTTGTHDITYTGVGGFTVGEEIVGGTSGARGIVTDEDIGTNHLYYVLKTAVQFSGVETITGQVSGATCAFSSVADLVAGYGTDIRIMTVDRYFTGGTAPSGDFVPGELCTQAGSTWQGWFMSYDPATDRMYFQDANADAPGAGIITGGVSTETYDPASNATSTVSTFDLGDGSGWEDYSAAVAADITNSDPQPVLNCYEWAKYLTRKESTTILGGPGSTVSGVQGRIYRGLNVAWPEVKESPWGTFAGGKMFGARGVFIIKETLASADIQNFQLTNNDGDTRTPPNLQVISISVPEAGVRASAYRTAAPGSTTIQRTEFKVGAVGGGYNQAADTKILVAAQDRSVSPIPADVPDVGTIRVLDPNDSGNYLRFPYSAVDKTNNWFQLAAGTIGAVTGGVDLVLNDNVHACLIEEESTGTSVQNTIQYVTPINVYWVARKKGYQPADGPTTFGSGGAAIASNMQVDDVVNLP